MAWKEQRNKGPTPTKSKDSETQSPKDYLDRNVRTKIKKAKTKSSTEARVTRSNSQERRMVKDQKEERADSVLGITPITEEHEQTTLEETQSFIECDNESQGASISADERKSFLSLADSPDKGGDDKPEQPGSPLTSITEVTRAPLMSEASGILAIEGVPGENAQMASTPKPIAQNEQAQLKSNILKKGGHSWQRSELYRRAQDAKNIIERGLALGSLLTSTTRREEFQGALTVIEETLLEFELRFQQSEILLNINDMASKTRVPSAPKTGTQEEEAYTNHLPSATARKGANLEQGSQQPKANKTFAEAAKQAASTVVIEAQSLDSQSEEDLNEILVGKLAGKVSIRAATQVQGKGWVLQCGSSAQARLLKTELECPEGSAPGLQTGQFKAHIGRPKRSNISIRGIPKGTSEDLIYAQILRFSAEDKSRAQDSGVKGPIIDKKFKTNRGTEVWIISLPTNMAKEIVEKSPFRIGLNICTVATYFKLRRCYNCQRFGHVASSCENETVCAECSDQHTGPCDRREKNCENCNIYDRINNCVSNSTHPAYAPECPCYRELVALARLKRRELTQNEIVDFFVNPNSSHPTHDQRTSNKYKYKSAPPIYRPQEQNEWHEVSYKRRSKAPTSNRQHYTSTKAQNYYSRQSRPRNTYYKTVL